MATIPLMTEHQQRVHCAMALLEERDLREFFRAIRYLRDSRPEVEIVNVELDRGVSLLDIFGPLGPFAGILRENLLDLQVVHMADGRWSIAFGFRGPEGYGGHWTLKFLPGGGIHGLDGGLCWLPKPWRTRH